MGGTSPSDRTIGVGISTRIRWPLSNVGSSVAPGQTTNSVVLREAAGGV
jgi:hypothetical protein